MRRVQLIHWNSAEAKHRVESLRSAGYKVAHDARVGPSLLRELRENPPLAVVIDLTRFPSQGRDVALAIRQYKATRHVPLVFAEGGPEKVARIQAILPDAVYTAWGRIGVSLKRAIAHPPRDPVTPSLLEGYSGTPLPKKLGIKANSVVALAGAPQGFRKTLGDLPGGVLFREKAGGRCDLTIWFTRSRRELERWIKRMAALAGRAPLWIAWPKKDSGLAADLSQQLVRETGLASGLVDYKICAIDATWSGLLFRRRALTQRQP